MFIKMLINGKNGTNGILKVFIVVFCGCFHIINKNTVKISVKMTKSAIIYPSLKSSAKVNIRQMIIRSATKIK
jgi:hypothetical protein